MILINTGPTTLTKTWYVDGAASDPGTITIGVVDKDGTEVVAPLTAVADNGDGTFEYSLAVQTEVSELAVTWTEAGGQSQTDYIEVIGGWLFTIAEMRAFHSADLASTSTYTNDDIAGIREQIQNEFEHICGVSFVPRYRQQTLRGNGQYAIEVDRARVQEVLSCTISGTAQTAADLVPADVAPIIHHTGGEFTPSTRLRPRNVQISYKHGYLSVPPQIRRAALIAAHARIKKDVTGAGVPYNASSWNDGTGQYVSFAANDQSQRWYGIAEVDSTLRQFLTMAPVV